MWGGLTMEKCRRCKKREVYSEDEIFCVFCEEQIFDARIEREEEKQRRKEEEGENVE